VHVIDPASKLHGGTSQVVDGNVFSSANGSVSILHMQTYDGCYVESSYYNSPTTWIHA
jgi:hypothetical protein